MYMHTCINTCQHDAHPHACIPTYVHTHKYTHVCLYNTIYACMYVCMQGKYGFFYSTYGYDVVKQTQHFRLLNLLNHHIHKIQTIWLFNYYKNVTDNTSTNCRHSVDDNAIILSTPMHLL